MVWREMVGRDGGTWLGGMEGHDMEGHGWEGWRDMVGREGRDGHG